MAFRVSCSGTKAVYTIGAVAVFEKSSLGNGVRVVTAPMPQVGSVSCFVMLAAGSRYETPEAKGIAHFSEHERFAVVGAGRDLPTVLECVLKLREGVHVAAEAHHTEQLLHGHLAAIDASVRCFVLEGEGRMAERAGDAVAALEQLGCETTLLATSHPVVDIVRFQRLTVDLADARGIDPDVIRRDEEPWERARKAYA